MRSSSVCSPSLSELDLIVSCSYLLPISDVVFNQPSEGMGKAYSKFVFISLCSKSCTFSERSALITAIFFSIFSIEASEAMF